MNPKNKAALSHVFHNSPCSISSHLGQVVELRRGTWLRDQLVCYFGTTDSLIPTPSLPPYWGLGSRSVRPVCLKTICACKAKVLSESKGGHPEEWH